MKKTDRQIVVDHFVDQGFAFHDPVDLAMYFADDLKKAEPIFPSEFTNEILNAGYRSPIADELTKEIKQAVEVSKKKKDK